MNHDYNSCMTASAGTKLGPYEIVALIGAGGMGELYKARDTRLNRDVAVKVLPESFADDEDRLRLVHLRQGAADEVTDGGRNDDADRQEREPCSNDRDLAPEVHAVSILLFARLPPGVHATPTPTPTAAIIRDDARGRQMPAFERGALQHRTDSDHRSA